MSRTDRHQHALATLTRRKPKQLSRAEITGLLRRQFRRDMVARGLLTDEDKQKPSIWTYPIGVGKTGRIKALTRSEARSLIKKALGLPRLPPGFVINKVGDGS